MVSEEVPRLLTPPRQSFFLFGPRGTGKSTWVRRHFSTALQVNLLDEGLYQELLARPAGFADRLRVAKRGSWVCVDEVQRIPGLLNEVHRAIEEQHLKFVLLGSSARKLRRAGVNLLAGRALRRSMHPFLPMELGARFSLRHALEVGTLPIVLASESPEQTLQAYVQSYLKEEIQAEALVRNLGGFARFLQIAAVMHGQVVNAAGLARDAGVSRTTVNDYLDVLDDTLLTFRLPGYEARLRIRERKHPRLYWVDPGVVRAAKQQLGPVAIEERGALFEGLVATLLRGWNDYRGLYDSISYWAPTEGRLEVDFLLQRGKRFIAIEVKSGKALRSDDLAGLKAIESLAGLERRLIVYPEIGTMKTQQGIEVLSFEKLVDLLETQSL